MISFSDATKIKDDGDFVRECIRSVVRGICYHEEELVRAHQNLATAQSLVERLGCSVDQQQALKIYEEDEDNEPVGSADKLAQWLFGRAVWYVRHHEKKLSEEHALFGVVKTLIPRGSYDLSVDDIAAEVRRKYLEN